MIKHMILDRLKLKRDLLVAAAKGVKYEPKKRWLTLDWDVDPDVQLTVEGLVEIQKHAAVARTTTILSSTLS